MFVALIALSQLAVIGTDLLKTLLCNVTHTQRHYLVLVVFILRIAHCRYVLQGYIETVKVKYECVFHRSHKNS